MSDPKLISPLLDGFALGKPMSSHDGVRCCPAIKENSDRKYIVKIITIPPSQSQIDALLLAGAYKDPSGAMDYYRIIGEEVMKEAELLTTLSKLDGFLPYEGWQMEPITKRRLGYEVYLVGTYKRSLEKYVRRNPVTHLEAVNLALDMCSALAVCRQAGSLYVDLKPNNIFMSDKKEYRIGDLGFISMDALSYTSLPDKYRSQYTPPELFDPMAPLNLTIDTYAVGMILYQLYNEGQLPFQEKAPEEALPMPRNADYELAEIIMKAIHPDPQQRWKDPQEMGRALVDYMQRNVINDTPITPHIPLETVTPEIPVAKPQPEPAPVTVSAETETESSTVTTEDPAIIEPTAEEPDTQESVVEEPVSEASVSDDPATDEAPEDETLPSEEDALSLLPHEMSDDLSRIIAKADDLITHEFPQDLLVPETPVQEDPFGFVAVNPEDVDDSDIPLDPLMEEPEPDHTPKKKRKSFASGETKRIVKKVFSAILVLTILGGLGFGLFWGYQNYYLQTIDALTIYGDRNHMKVTVETEVDEKLLRVVCSDNYGNVQTERLVDGSASFTDLLPNTMYKIEVEIDGFHTLAGETSNVFTTDATTNIFNFSAVTGAEDGSLLLSFTCDGDEPDMWTVIYSAEGEEEQRKNFDGNSVSVTGLSVGKMYTFTLDAGDKISLSGETKLTTMASRLILAQNLTVNSTDGTDIVVSWNTPGDILVDSWSVRCYSTAGYEQQITVTDTQAQFTGVDPHLNYTVEVTAAGMTQPARTSITENPITLSNFVVDDTTPGSLELSWNYNGNDPTGGWLVMYSVDGSDASKGVVKVEEPSAVITPKIPEANYRFIIQAADSTTIYGNTFTYTSPAAPDFSQHNLSVDSISGNLVKTPAEEDWTYDDVGSSAFANSFTSGDAISAVLKAGDAFYLTGSQTDILFVIRDAHGSVLFDMTSSTQKSWRDLWFPGDDKYAELDIPKVPTNPGNYSVTIYFNGAKASKLDFTITN